MWLHRCMFLYNVSLFCPVLMKFGLHKQKPLSVKFYEKCTLVPKLCVYRWLSGAVWVWAVQGCKCVYSCSCVCSLWWSHTATAVCFTPPVEPSVDKFACDILHITFWIDSVTFVHVCTALLMLYSITANCREPAFTLVVSQWPLWW